MSKNLISLLLFSFILNSCASGSRSILDYFNFDEKLESIEEEDDSLTSLDEKPLLSEKTTYFIDKAEAYGLADIKAYNFNIVDINGDGYSDIVVIPSFYSEPIFYYFNIFEKKFEKGRNPFPFGIKASYLLFYDINGDKTLDAIAGVLNQKTELSKEPLKIYYGELNKENELSFKPVKTKLTASPNSSIGLVDYDLDGRLDFYIGNWFSRYKNNPIPHPDYFIKNTEKGFIQSYKEFDEESKKSADGAMFTKATPTYAVQVCDMDQNGYPDILTTSTNSFANKLWMNRYAFREKLRYFQNVGVESGFASDSEGLLNTQGGGRTFGLACADYNNDGIMDVFVGELTHNYDNEGVDKSSILTGRTLKESPRFFRTEYTQDAFDPDWHQADRRGIWADFNNDGLLDLIVDNSGYPPHTKLIIFEQLPDHSFVDKSIEYEINIPNPIATVLLDVNRDGRMDILTSKSLIRNESESSKIYLFENTIENKNRSLRFYLRGHNSNYHGLNATIVMKVKTQQGIVYRRQAVSYSYGALPPQNEEGVLFGLNEGDEIINVMVRWPFATKSSVPTNELETYYKFNLEFDTTMNITLCENGDYLIGRRECLNQEL